MKKSIRAIVTVALVVAAWSQTAQAVVYPLPPANSRLVGENLEITVPQDNKLPLEAFAAQYQMGLSNMLEANPHTDVYLPKPGSKLIIPQQLILPDAPREGIIINSAEMRLYYYPKGTHTVVVLPIGIGELGKDTPMNWTTKVENKRANPTWTPTAKMHAEYVAAGTPLPRVVPAGPDNPMGLYALYIGRLYAVHGTNANFGIGLRVSHGCVRLRADDIKWLFDNVPVGTRVQFINQPIKATVEPDGSRWVEIHNPLSANEEEFNSRAPVPLDITPAVNKIISDNSVNTQTVDQALQRRSGMPVDVNGQDSAAQPVMVPENSNAQPKEEPLTPVTPQGINEVQPGQGPAADAPVDQAPGTQPQAPSDNNGQQPQVPSDNNGQQPQQINAPQPPVEGNGNAAANAG